MVTGQSEATRITAPAGSIGSSNVDQDSTRRGLSAKDLEMIKQRRFLQQQQQQQQQQQVTKEEQTHKPSPEYPVQPKRREGRDVQSPSLPLKAGQRGQQRGARTGGGDEAGSPGSSTGGRVAEERRQAQLAEEEDQQRKRIEMLKITNPDLYVALYAADEEVLPLARPVERRRIFQRGGDSCSGRSGSRIGTEPTVADVSAVTRGVRNETTRSMAAAPF